MAEPQSTTDRTGSLIASVCGRTPEVHQDAFVAPTAVVLGAVTLAAGSSVWYHAVLHGCAVEDDVLVGMGATVLNGARIGTGSLVAAGAVVPQGMQVPPNSLVAGVPAKVRRELTEADRAGIRLNGEGYVLLGAEHRRTFG